MTEEQRTKCEPGKKIVVTMGEKHANERVGFENLARKRLLGSLNLNEDRFYPVSK